jgi:hypothetical protein
MAGVAGELALHFVARMLGLKARILLPSLNPQPIDHLISIESQALRIQSKTSRIPKGFSINTIYGGFKFPVDKRDEGLDYYSFALVADDDRFADSDCITVHLFAFVPVGFVERHAVQDRDGRYITYQDLQSVSEPFSHTSLGQCHALPVVISTVDKAYQMLTSPNAGDRLLEALDLIDSPSDAFRVLEMLEGDPRLLKALDRSPSGRQPESAFGLRAARLMHRYSQDIL